MKEWNEVAIPETGIPTMLSPEEQRYLRWLTARHWRQAGHVLEIGPWLGGSTACLAQGMRDRGADGRWRLHTVDSFVWCDFMGERADVAVEPGGSFQPVFERNLAPWSDYVVAWRRALPDDPEPRDELAQSKLDPRAAPLESFRWEPEEPVEVLFVDGAKSWTGMAYLLREIAPWLADDALLVCQDYKFWANYWVPVLMELVCERLGSALRVAHDLSLNTVAFALRGGLPREVADGLPGSVDELGAERGTALIDRAAERLRRRGDEGGAAVLLAALTRLLGNLGLWDEAVAAFRDAESCWPARMPAGNLELAHAWLEDARGREVPWSRRHRLRRAPVQLVRSSARAVRRVLRRGDR